MDGTDSERGSATGHDRSVEGARAILRVPEVLIAVANRPQGLIFAEIREQLRLPKSSLHRLLRTLEQGGYLVNRSGAYHLGPQSARLATVMSRALPSPRFPESVRPILDWLALQSKESVILAVLTADRREVSYIDVINSDAPLRFTVPLGNRRPLYAAASGQAMLAFLPPEEQERYIAEAAFQQLTKDTLRREDMPARLRDIRTSAVVFDRNGSFVGASAVASPCFDGAGEVHCAVSIAGPTERMDTNIDRLRQLSREAGERASRLLGYAGAYPPP